MPPKAAKSTAMTEEVYFFYASLRVLMAQTGASPNWDIVAESLGGTTKPHTLYCRLDTLKKKATAGFNEGAPELNKLIDDHVAAGTINKKGGKTASASKGTPKTPRAKKIVEEEEDDEDDDTPTTKQSRKRTATPAAKGRAKKAKVDEGLEDGEIDDDILEEPVKLEHVET